jgi:hypothetical protein
MVTTFRNFTFLIVLFVTLLINGCGNDQSGYFPLKENQVREYRTRKNIKVNMGTDIKDEHFYTTTVLNSRILSGKKTTPIKSEDSLFFYSNDKGGVYQFAIQNSNQLDPTFFDNSKYLFKFPIKLGTTWESKELPSMALIDEEKALIDIVNSIDKIDEIVTVPSGTYKQCIRIKSVGNILVYVEQYPKSLSKISPNFLKPSKKLTIESYNWYAPGSGLIKSIEKNSCTASGLTFCISNEGEIITELVKFQK